FDLDLLALSVARDLHQPSRVEKNRAQVVRRHRVAGVYAAEASHALLIDVEAGGECPGREGDRERDAEQLDRWNRERRPSHVASGAPNARNEKNRAGSTGNAVEYSPPPRHNGGF